MLTVTGTDVSIWNSSLTSPFGTCVLVGTAETPAGGFSLRLSTVSGCGTSNTLTNADGGVHGVWLAYVDQAGVSESIITNNKTRGLQLWPHVTNSTITQNLIYANSGAVNVGWKDWSPYLWPANNSISHNIIGGSTFAFSKDTHEIYGFMPNDGVDRSNIVWSNCVANQGSPAALYGGNGLTIQNSNVPAANGTFVDPPFADAADGNFKLRADSPCHQFGPMSIQYDGAPEPPVIPGAPTLGGIARVGSTLTVTPGAWDPAPVTLSYQWHRLTAAGSELLPVTTSAYQVSAADVNSRLRVTVTGSKAGYTPATASIESAAVQLGTLTGSTPTVSGTPTVGSTLTANPGTWPTGTTITYQWVRLGAGLIPGATARTYTLTTADLGTNIAIRVYATAPGYTNTHRTSTGTMVTAAQGAATHS